MLAHQRLVLGVESMRDRLAPPIICHRQRHYRSGCASARKSLALERQRICPEQWRGLRRLSATALRAILGDETDYPREPAHRRPLRTNSTPRPSVPVRVPRGRLYIVVGMNFCYMRILLIGTLALYNDLSTLAMRPSSNRYNPPSNSQIAPGATHPKITSDSI